MFARLFKFLNEPNEGPKPVVGDLKLMLDTGNMEEYGRSGGGTNRAWEGILNKGNLLAFQSQLIEDGIFELKYVGSGSSVVIAEITKTSDPKKQGKLLRFRGRSLPTEPGTWTPPKIDQMISTWMEREINGCKIVGVNRATPLDQFIASGACTRAEAQFLVDSVRSSVIKSSPPCLFLDWKIGGSTKFEQIGLLRDHTPTIIDMGSVISLESLESSLQSTPSEMTSERIRQEVLAVANMELGPIPKAFIWDGKWRTNDGRRKVDAYFE